ncbi:uncharacterized protein [Medicago truncatula]|uniref:uncharacterized protein n=1 Tax=Medicago truncatula TaxID=3880 RepID=UPI0019670750|nr:uncharacterized protein LOC11446866 [Medicago truncatula]
MRIEECKELKHIIEDDLENKNKSSNFMSTTKTCFPKLERLVVIKCDMLKYVFPVSICNELPELNVLIIREADELDEIFASEGRDEKVEIPNLEYVVFENLPSLCHAQGIHLKMIFLVYVITSTELMNEQSMDKQRPLGETDIAGKPSQVSETSVEEELKFTA